MTPGDPVAASRWPPGLRRLADRPDTVLLLGVTMLALVIRLVVVALTVGHLRISSDAGDYLRLAQSLAHGHGWGTSRVAPGGGPEGLRPPGYPLWLAGVLRVTGGGVTAVRVVGAIVGATVPALVMSLASSMWADRRVVTAAGLLAAVLPSLVIAAVTPMSESLFVPMSLGIVVAAVAYRRTGRPAALVTAGVLLGLATLVRPVGIVLVVPLVVLAAGAPVRRSRRLIAAAAALAVAAAPVAAWEIREISAFHTVVPLTTQGGYLLAGTYDATSATVPGQPGVWLPYPLDPTENAIVRAYPDADEATVSGLLDHAALRYFTHHPRYDVTVLTDNTLRLFDLSDPDFESRVTQSEYGVGSWGGRAEQVGALALLVLAVAGAALGAIRRRDTALWSAPVLLLVVTIPVQSYTRFRAPIDPYLVLLAAVALARIASAAAARRSARVAATTAVRASAAHKPRVGAHIASLTSLRFVAALGVFAVHTAVLLGGRFPHGVGYGRLVISGATGVSFFFILSGFVLTWSHRPGESGREFIRRRAARILPNQGLTWAATAIVYSAIGLAIPTGPALASLVLVHAWVPLMSWYNAMDTPSWSLCCEAFFYALFPVMLLWLRRLRSRDLRIVAAGGVLISVVAAVASGPLAAATSHDVGNWLVVDFPVARLGEFVLGIAMALELKRGTLPRISPLAAAVSVIAALAVVDLANTQRLLVVVTVLPFAALIAAAARRELDGGMRWLRHPAAVRLGQWSFAFYLVHWLVLVVALHLHPGRYDAAGAAAAVVLTLAASIAISAGVFQLWERPMERALRPRHDEPVVTRPEAVSVSTRHGAAWR